MKNLLFIFITLITISNVSYASFPVANDFVYYNDTIIPDSSQNTSQESIDQYHERIQRQGFDLSSCMCESCSKNGKMKGSGFTAPRLKNVLFFLIILIIFILIITLIINANGERGPEGSGSNFDFQDWWDSP